ncbi:MAG: hypothetical protein H6Q72_1413 [Firmicutes bacterium]|nr:hypothetical protein [Bacillota bacterium]
MKKILCLLLFLMFASGVCLANDRYWWINSNDKIGFFFDTETIKFEKEMNFSTLKYSINKNQANVWIKTVYNANGVNDMIQYRNKYNLPTDDWIKLSYSMANFIFDFKERKMKCLSTVYYDSDGNILEKYSSQDVRWEDVIPNTNGEYWSKILLEYSKGVGYNSMYENTIK